jgi:hypothetical protein
MFRPVNGSWVSGAATEVVAGPVGTAGVGGWVPVPEIGGGTGNVVVVVGGTVVVVVVVVVGGGAVVVVVVGGGVVVVVVVEQPHGLWVAIGADECTAGTGAAVALQAAPPSVTLKAIMTSADPMARTVRFTVHPSGCVVGVPGHPGGRRRLYGCGTLDREAPPPTGRRSLGGVTWTTPSRSELIAPGPGPST